MRLTLAYEHTSLPLGTIKTPMSHASKPHTLCLVQCGDHRDPVKYDSYSRLICLSSIGRKDFLLPLSFLLLLSPSLLPSLFENVFRQNRRG